jgi:DinB superfamily
MSDRKDKLRQTIQADDAASLAIFKRLSPEQWERPVPSDEGADWKARDVLAHVAVSEGGQLVVIGRVLAGEGGVPADFELNRYNRRAVQKQAERSTDDFLASIERDHANVLGALEAASDADLDKTGRHARGDTLTIEQFFLRITEHRRQHAEELAHNLGL